MAIGNIQYVNDHIRLYSKALRPEKSSKQTTKKFNWNLQENAVEALKPYFAPPQKLSSIELFPNMKMSYSGVSLVRIGNK